MTAANYPDMEEHCAEQRDLPQNWESYTEKFAPGEISRDWLCHSGMKLHLILVDHREQHPIKAKSPKLLGA